MALMSGIHFISCTSSLGWALSGFQWAPQAFGRSKGPTKLGPCSPARCGAHSATPQRRLSFPTALTVDRYFHIPCREQSITGVSLAHAGVRGDPSVHRAVRKPPASPPTRAQRHADGVAGTGRLRIPLTVTAATGWGHNQTLYAPLILKDHIKRTNTPMYKHPRH